MIDDELTGEEAVELLELKQSMEELTEFMKQFRIRFKETKI
jgi:hypothetical protein